MKFTALFAIVATASAITVSTPKESYEQKAANLAEGLAVVAGQQAFEKKHVADHAAAMAKAQAEQMAVQQHMRTARIDSLQHNFMKE